MNQWRFDILGRNKVGARTMFAWFVFGFLSRLSSMNSYASIIPLLLLQTLHFSLYPTFCSLLLLLALGFAAGFRFPCFCQCSKLIPSFKTPRILRPSRRFLQTRYIYQTTRSSRLLFFINNMMSWISRSVGTSGARTTSPGGDASGVRFSLGK